MSDTKLLQAILDKANAVDKKVNTVDKKIDEVKAEAKNTRESLVKRMDKLGLQLARLEDDAPTIDEFEKLIRRVTKLENRVFEN